MILLISWLEPIVRASAPGRRARLVCRHRLSPLDRARLLGIAEVLDHIVELADQPDN